MLLPRCHLNSQPPESCWMLYCLSYWDRHLQSYCLEYWLWWYRYFVCKVTTWNIKCVQSTFIFNSQTDVLEKIALSFWTENISTQGALESLTFIYMLYTLPFELMGPDICCPMFLNIGSGCTYIFVCKVIFEVYTGNNIHFWWSSNSINGLETENA